MPEIPTEAFLRRAPDWLCETVSPSTERLDRGTKLAIYAREGVSHLWLVNPLTETVEAHRLKSGHWMLVATHAGDTDARIEPFEAISLELWRHWGRSEPHR